MKSDEQIVRTVNHCLDLHRLYRLLTIDEWNRFIELVEQGSGDDGTTGLLFSGDPTGFHLWDAGAAIDCASIETSAMPQFFYSEALDTLRKQEVS